MEKQIKDFEVESLDWGYGIEISEMEKHIQEVKNLGATHIVIEPGIEYDCPTLSVVAICRRHETDAEFAQRVKEYEIREELIKQQELKTLASLKAKYNL